MTQNQEAQKVGDLTARIKRIEVANTEIDTEEAKGIDKQRKNDLYDEPRVRIIFESGGILQIRQREEDDIPIEESFRPDDPHSVWDRFLLNGFYYEEDWDAATRVQKAAVWNLKEMKRRAFVESLEDDWENLSHCFEEEEVEN